MIKLPKFIFDLGKNQSGMAVLFTFLIISAAALIMAKSATSLSMGEVDISNISNFEDAVLALADGCGEEILQQFKMDPAYSANAFALSVGDGECIIDTAGVGNERTISIVGNINNFYKEISINLTLDSGNVIVNSWKTVELDS